MLGTLKSLPGTENKLTLITSGNRNLSSEKKNLEVRSKVLYRHQSLDPQHCRRLLYHPILVRLLPLEGGFFTLFAGM
jgi:hypothetical protein